MTQQQEIWIRHNMARRQAMMAAVMRMRYSAAGGSSGSSAPTDEGIEIPDIPAPDVTMYRFQDGTISSWEQLSALPEEELPLLMSKITDLSAGKPDIQSSLSVMDCIGIDDTFPVLSSIVIPDGILSVIFQNNGNITELTIPNTVTDMQMIAGCPALKTLKIGSGLSTVSMPNDSSIETPFIIPGEGVQIQISKDNQTYKTQNGFVLTKDGLSVVQFFGNEISPTIPAGVTNIGLGAFAYCERLTDVTIPNGVTSIGEGAFQSCTGLTDVTIPAGVTSIGQGAFQSCTGLTDVTIPAGVTSIGEYMFAGCTGLTGVTIGDGVTSIGDGAFYDCTNLTSVTIPDSVTSIEGSAFTGCSGLTGMTIPAGVETIGPQVFLGCSGLTAVTIPDSVESIGEMAFLGCQNLHDVYIDKSVETVQNMNDYPWFIGQSMDDSFPATIHCSDGDIFLNESNSR